MSIGEYFDLIRKVLQEPIINGCVEMLKKELSKHGYTNDTGIKTAQHYFQEMKRAVRDGKENTCFHRFHTLIVNEDYYYFCEDGLGFGAQFKISLSGFERFGEVLNESMKAEKMAEPQPQRLTKELNNNQLQLLFDGLVKGGFLPSETSREGFNYVFGCTDKPATYKLLEWLKNVQLLRELIQPIRKTQVIADMERAVPNFFSKNGKPVKLAKPDQRVKERTKDSEYIKTLIEKINDPQSN